MPDPTPEQPPSWPPASEPAATPTNPPRITARGVGHLPSVLPEDDAVGQAAPEPTSAPSGYADLAPSEPPTQQTPEFPPAPAETEVPRQQQWGEAPDMSGEWPPRENQDWISQQARSGGWGTGQGGAPWPGPSVGGPEVPAQPYLPDPNAAPYGAPNQAPPYQAQPSPAETFQPDPYRADPYHDDPYHGNPQHDPHQGDQYRADPFAAGQQPYGSDPLAAQAPAPAAPAPAPAPPAQTPPTEPEPAPQTTKATPPPTHAGVRYAIYGIGGIITLGLIVAIVLMLGGPPASEPSGGEETDGAADTGTAEGLDAERYAELAGAAGSAEWFEYRYGTAGENTASEEIAALSGDAVAGAPLLGEADRNVQGQLAYVTDDAELSGIDHVTVLEATDGQIGITPRAGGRFSDDGSPELELREGTTADCLDGLGGDLGRPVALARPEQSGEIDAHSLIAFSSGIVATAGISGAQGGTCLQLPDDQVPTDVALTDGNELALVTTWNPTDQTGTLVVIALADKEGSYQSSWSEPYPGLPNPGHFGTAEIVGQVELPMSAPTSVDAWSDSSGSVSIGRTTVADTPHEDTVATAAHAIVGSLSESQAITVDLAPVLQGLAARHLEGAEYTFDATASEPASFDSGVADVALHGETFAVATGDGFVHEMDEALAETAAVEVGANPSCLVVGAQSGQFIATSRGESAVRWVSGGEVVKELADSRITDAMCASETPGLDVQGYSGSADVLLVSDFGGQALHTYLVDSATLVGGAEVGGGGFAYGGAYSVPGMPFAASVTLDLAD
ncbi:hypothetical protein L0U85_10070 [Glycomyces sp. L485]|uniref:hypothetical protein n=1 Tax=Glycomyces sp. L485 TaxID=2909235 RepID=UPI001F4A1436|nr:hypothetical protein [Glycomyces sp. L485]MCH7231194.1 hypothetical protein [Glycomyces sp. L485]